MVDTSDFLQADDVSKVIGVPVAISRGNHTDEQIEAVIGVNSEGRQGRYYRLAAEKLGLVKRVGANHTILTSQGEHFVQQNSGAQTQYLKSAILGLPVFCRALEFISGNRPSSEELKSWFVKSYPGEENTAERRFSTFKKYLQFCEVRF